MSTPMQTCYRHGDRRAGVICQRCDRPICPSCMHQASVGFHCPECAKKGAQKVVRARDLRTRPIVSQVVIALNVVVFVAGVGAGFDTSRRFVIEGGLNGPLVATGEWYRIVTSGFLHADVIHLGFNMFLLYRLGMLLEPEFGKVRFGLAYVVSLLGGSFVVLLVEPNAITLGASGAVFGLLGVAAAGYRARGVNIFDTGLGALLFLNIVMSFRPGVSIAGHAGGLAAGFVVGMLLTDVGQRYLRTDAAIVGSVVGLGVVLAGASIAIAY